MGGNNTVPVVRYDVYVVLLAGKMSVSQCLQGLCLWCTAGRDYMNVVLLRVMMSVSYSSQGICLCRSSQRNSVCVVLVAGIISVS